MSRSNMPRKGPTIVFDAECLVTANRSGVSYYTKGLIEALAHSNKHVTLIGHYFNFLGKRTIPELPHAPNIRYISTTLCPAKVPNMLRRLGVWIPFEVFTRRRADFHIFPAFIGWPSLFGTRSAPMVHDVTFLDHPEYVNNIVRFDLKKLVPKEIQRAAFIITNSDFSAQRLKETYPLEKKAVVVGHIPPVHAITVGRNESKKVISELGISGKYILFLGNLEPRKNIPGLISAYARLTQGVRDQYALVLVGGKGWLDEEIMRAIDDARADGMRIITPGYVNDTERAALYTNASAFVLVSFYEGFGMPLLEAMTYKTPLLVSDIPAHREAAGEAALFSDPNDTKEIAGKLRRLLHDKTLRSSLIKAGTQRLRLFSWQSIAEQVMKHISAKSS